MNESLNKTNLKRQSFEPVSALLESGATPQRNLSATPGGTSRKRTATTPLQQIDNNLSNIYGTIQQTPKRRQLVEIGETEAERGEEIVIDDVPVEGPAPTRATNKKAKSKKVPFKHNKLQRFIPREQLNQATSTVEKKSWKQHGFADWLSYLKAKWKLQRSVRIIARNAREYSAEPTVATTSGTVVLNARDNICHVLQVVETKIPGHFTVFAVVNGLMKRFNLTVPRTIYVDDIRGGRVTSVGRLVQKILPKMRPSAHLYEYSLDEAQFAKKMTQFNVEMCLMNINGIFETKIPLLFKALAEMGTNFHAMEVFRNQGGEISLNQVNRLSRFEANYMQFEQVRHLFFYEFAHTGRSVFALFVPSMQKAYIFVVNRVRMDLVNLENLYREEMEKFIRRRDDSFAKLFDGIVMQPVQCTSAKDATRQLHSILNSLNLTSSVEPSLLCVQSNRPMERVFRDFADFTGFPYVRINSPEPAELMNRLDWANLLAKRAIQHFFNSFIYLRDYWLMAEYLEIPVGNIPEDIPIFALDLFFARQLNLKNFLLWASSSSTPDFGGKELDDLRLACDWDTVAFRPNSGHIVNREIFEARNVVVELGLGAVAVTALLQSTKIAEAEGSSELTGFVSDAKTMSIGEALSYRLGLTNYDEGVATSSVLRVLKEVFHELIRDIHLHKSLIADQLVTNMHRWLLNPNSLLYNPAISTHIQTLMRKLCLLLVSEVTRLGATVIHCSATRIILSTNRNTSALARAFVDSLVVALAQKTMFASIQIYVRDFSSPFLWLDPGNFGRVNCTANEGNTEDDMELKFALADQLPEERGCHKLLLTTVAGYLAMVSKKLREDPDITDEDFGEFCGKILTDEIAPTLFRIVSKLVEFREQFRTASGDSRLDVPSIFVTAICRVLSANELMVDDVDKIRDQLNLILQSDSSSQHPFADFAASLNIVLEHVLCKKCNQTIELNVCAKPKRIQDSDEHLPFHCPQCKTTLSETLIEEMLMERVSKMHVSYTLQDWTCKMCKKVGSRYLSQRCDCNNPFVNSIRPDEFQLNLRTLKQVAKTYGLRNLDFVIEQIVIAYS